MGALDRAWAGLSPAWEQLVSATAASSHARGLPEMEISCAIILDLASRMESGQVYTGRARIWRESGGSDQGWLWVFYGAGIAEARSHPKASPAAQPR